MIFFTEYQNNISNTKYFVAIEVDDLKMKEIEFDSSIKILYTKKECIKICYNL